MFNVPFNTDMGIESQPSQFTDGIALYRYVECDPRRSRTAKGLKHSHPLEKLLPAVSWVAVISSNQRPGTLS